MKNILLLIASLTSIAFISCEDVLDKRNLGAIDESYIWEDPDIIELNVNSFYANYAPTGTFGNRYEFGIIADEGRSGYNGRGVLIINGARFSADRNDVPYQSWNYTGIRKLNEFLEKINEQYILPTTATYAQIQRRNRFIGEAKFFRAHLYFDMIRVYGGVPILTLPTSQYEKDSSIVYPKRSTTEESFEFVIKDLTEAADLLPVTYDASNWGRITKGAALAYLGRVQSFKASPLFNLNNEVALWQNVYTTYKQVEALNVYNLHSNFPQIWIEKGLANKEIILFVDYMKGRKMHGWDAANMMRSQAVGDATAACPVQELVDAFPMIDGTPYVISSPETNPYLNRDPRLRHTVVFNGDTYGPRKDTIFTFVSESTDPLNPKYNFNGIDSHQSCTSTGYYMRKMTDESLDGKKGDYAYGTGSFTQWVEIRYAEVLLGIAEAANELGNTEEAVDYIKMIRKRAGILAGENNRYGVKIGINQAECRELIQNERYIEFAFENKRYWDLRRWKLAHINLSKQLTAMEIRKVITGGSVSYTYKRRLQRHDQSNKPVFLEKFYLLPLPRNELIKNPNLEQNNDWK